MAVCIVLPQELSADHLTTDADCVLQVVSSRVVHLVPHRNETVASALQRVCSCLKVGVSSFQFCRGSVVLNGAELLELPAPGCEIHLVRRHVVDLQSSECGMEIFNCGVAMPRRLKWAIKEVSAPHVSAKRSAAATRPHSDSQWNANVSSSDIS